MYKGFTPTEWNDQWIAENYPNSDWYITETDEVVVFLGVDENGEDCY